MSEMTSFDDAAQHDNMPRAGWRCSSLRYELLRCLWNMVLYAAPPVLREGGPFEEGREGTEKDVSLSGCHLERLEGADGRGPPTKTSRALCTNP